MEIKVSSPNDWLRELEVEIEPERLRSELERHLADYAPRAELPGFRKGRAPRAVLERRLGPTLEQSAARELVEQTAAAALEEQGWRPAAEPELLDLELRPDKSIRFRLRVEVFPEFELKEYKGLAVERHEPSGFEAEFERRLRELQDRCATFRSVPGPAAAGKYLVVDWRTFDGEKEIAKPRTNLMLELGDPMNFREVNEGLDGASPGEERVVEVRLPDDHPDKEIAGRQVSFRFAVREVKEKNVPPVDEDLALALGFDSLDDLRKDLNDAILADRARLIANDLRNQIFDQLLAACPFDPPQSWVAYNVDRLRREYDLPDEAATQQRLTEVAARRARFEIIAAAIARKEDIQVTDDEIQAQARALAERLKRPVEDIAALVDTPPFRTQLLKDKVMDFLLEHAHVRGTLLGADGKPASSGDPQ
ncbi:MAG: trigger factor [bacterium]